jgi:hypothetical protein
MEKFKSVPELIQSLNNLTTRINKGTVGLEEFETTLRDARELYERLVILRYKAIEDRNLMGAPRQADIFENLPPAVAEPETEEIKPAVKQISLIDSIEEIKREKVSPPMEIIEPKPEVEKPAPVAEKKVVTPPPHILPSSRAPKDVELKGSVAEKMSHTPIKDLKVAIGLNQKFQFIKELFDADADAYKSAVSKLNSFSGGTEAEQYLRNELMATYGWDEEEPLVISFTELVQRRYL